MARAATGNPGTANLGNENGNRRPGATGDVSADLEAQIAHLRGEMSRLAEAVANAGSVIASDVKGSAKARSRRLQRSSEATLRDLRAQLDDIEQEISGRVRERPLTALAAAAGLGFLLALIARR